MPITTLQQQLITAVKTSNINEVLELLKTVNPNFYDDDCYTPLMYAQDVPHNDNCNHGNENYSVHTLIIGALIKYGAVFELGYAITNPLSIAAYNNKIDDVRRLIKENPEVVNEADSFGRTALFYSITKGNTAISIFLIENGANVNHADVYNFTPLHLACMYDHSELATIIIVKANKSTLNMQDKKSKQTPLHYAGEKGNVAVVRLLISFGADTEIGNKWYSTPLHAAFDSDIDVFRTLVESGVNPSYVPPDSEDGWTVLHSVAANGDEWLDYLEVLLECPNTKATLNIGDIDGKTPLELARQYASQSATSKYERTIDYLTHAASPAASIQKPLFLKTPTEQLMPNEQHVGITLDESRSKRKHIPLKKNQTSSLARSTLMERTDSLVQQVKDSSAFIVEHAHRRVDFCFYIMVFYYNSRKNITLASTQLQHGKGEGAGGSFTQACHSSFIANPVSFLSCYNCNGAPLKVQKLPGDNQFLNNLNSTVELARAVNNFDSKMEGKIGNPSECRRAFITILNQVSFGEKDPIEGLLAFYQIMKEFFDKQHYANETPESLIHALEYKGTFSGYDKDKRAVKQEYVASLLRINDQEEVSLITELDKLKNKVQQVYEDKFKSIQSEISQGTLGLPQSESSSVTTTASSTSTSTSTTSTNVEELADSMRQCDLNASGVSDAQVRSDNDNQVKQSAAPTGLFHHANQAATSSPSTSQKTLER